MLCTIFVVAAFTIHIAIVVKRNSGGEVRLGKLSSGGNSMQRGDAAILLGLALVGLLDDFFEALCIGTFSLLADATGGAARSHGVCENNILLKLIYF